MIQELLLLWMMHMIVLILKHSISFNLDLFYWTKNGISCEENPETCTSKNEEIMCNNQNDSSLSAEVECIKQQLENWNREENENDRNNNCKLNSDSGSDNSGFLKISYFIC